MLKGISSLIAILLILIAAGVGTGGYFLVKESPTTTTIPIRTTTTIPATTTIQEIKADFDLTIDIPKTSVSTGEDFSGKYNVERKGDPYEIYIVTLCRKEGDEDGCYSRGKGSLEKYDFGVQLKPCGGTTCVEDSFKTPGTYIFELKIYDCSEIENALGVACSIDVDHKEVAEQVSPIKTTKKTVIVTGEIMSTTIPQTTTTPIITTTTPSGGCQEGCTQTCENCKKGTYKCAYVSDGYKCIECITRWDCKSGYFCNHTTQECQEEPLIPACGEQGGNICSADDGCVCYGELLTSSDANCCCTGLCDPTEGTTAEDITKIWFESIIAGDWEKTFTHTVDNDGNAFSEDCRERLKKSLYNPWVGAICELEIGTATSCTGEYSIPTPLPEGIETICVPYSYTMTTTNGATLSSGSFHPLFKINDEWKVAILIPCENLPP